MPQSQHRAQPPRIPRPTQDFLEARAAAAASFRPRLDRQRRSIARGLTVLALAVLALSIARAGLDRVFVPGWWHQW